MEIITLLSIPAIVAIVEAIKYTEKVSDRYVPLIAIGAGLILGLFLQEIATGLVLGLSASGLYSGLKHIVRH